VGIDNIDVLENNVHAGTKYLARLRDHYFSDESMLETERMLFTMAGYNAGPNRINRLRRVTAARGLDPNVWFNNVELIVAADVGTEPVDYVANIYRYFIAYKRVLAELGAQDEVAATN
jgi:membrane-bound lytic murein transglycosylase MltF